MAPFASSAASSAAAAAAPRRLIGWILVLLVSFQAEGFPSPSVSLRRAVGVRPRFGYSWSPPRSAVEPKTRRVPRVEVGIPRVEVEMGARSASGLNWLGRVLRRRPAFYVRAGDAGVPLTKEVAQANNRETADRLIDVFKEREQHEWRHLLGFSDNWWEIADDVFLRIKERLETTEDATEELALRKMDRLLKETHDEVYEYRRTWREMKEASSRVETFEAKIAMEMETLKSEGFAEYMRDMLGRTEHDPNATPADKAEVRGLCERILEVMSENAMGIDNDVKSNFEKIANAPNKEAAKAEIDRLAEAGELDPRYLALMAKGYAGGKETDFTEEDMKETTLYMYEQMTISMRKQQPLEIRLLKYVLAFPTPRERKAALEEVLSPGVRYDDEGWYTAETTSPEMMLARTEDLIVKYRQNLKYFGELEPRPLQRAVAARGDADKDDIMKDIVVDSVYMYVPQVIERLREVREWIKQDFEGQLPEKVRLENDMVVTQDQDDIIMSGDNFMPY